jgi:tRNA pseudouridine synthase D (TruD).
MPRHTAAQLDLLVGMEYYISDCEGVGGRLRSSPEDFIVEEVLVNGDVVPSTLTGKGALKDRAEARPIHLDGY